MPVRTISGTDLTYALVIFDEKGDERPEPDGTLLSETLAQRVADPARPVTDVFFSSHGWQGDVPAAISQFDRWIAAMAAQQADRAAAENRPGGFAPLIIGLHWPSLPFGDEKAPAGAPAVLSAGGSIGAVAPGEVDAWAARIADTPRARAAIRTILEAARQETGATAPSPALLDAYAALFAESGLDARGSAAAPGADQEGFDPAAIIAQSGAGEAGDAAARHRRHAERPLPLAAAPALVLEDEGPRARVRRERRPRAAGAAADRRAAGALSPDGPQLRLHRRLGDGGGPRRRARPAAPGRLALSRPGRALALVVCERHPVRRRHGGLLPPHRQARPRSRPDRHDPLVARHRRRTLLSARRTDPPAARPRQRPAGVRRHRLVRHPGREGRPGHADARRELRLRLQGGGDLQPRGERDHQERRRRVGRAQRHRPSRGRACVLVGGPVGAVAARGDALARRRERRGAPHAAARRTARRRCDGNRVVRRRRDRRRPGGQRDTRDAAATPHHPATGATATDPEPAARAASAATAADALARPAVGPAGGTERSRPAGDRRPRRASAMGQRRARRPASRPGARRTRVVHAGLRRRRRAARRGDHLGAVRRRIALPARRRRDRGDGPARQRRLRHPRPDPAAARAALGPVAQQGALRDLAAARRRVDDHGDAAQGRQLPAEHRHHVRHRRHPPGADRGDGARPAGVGRQNAAAARHRRVALARRRRLRLRRLGRGRGARAPAAAAGLPRQRDRGDAARAHEGRHAPGREAARTCSRPVSTSPRPIAMSR